MVRTVARLPLLLVICAALVLVAPIGTRAATHAVAIAGFAFSPQELTVTVGDTVTWTNTDAVAHTATSTAGAFDSGEIAQGASYSVTFTSPGTFDYVCTPHPSMTGRVVVVAAAAPASPAPSGLPNVAMAERIQDAGLVRILGAMLLAGAAAGLVVHRRRGRRRVG